MGTRTVWVAVLAGALAFVLNRTLRFTRVQVREKEVTASLEPLAYARIPRDHIAEVRQIPWPWYRGFGIRIYGWQAVGFVGRPGGVVEFVLSEPVTVRALIPMPVRRLAVSVENPEALLDLLFLEAAPSRQGLFSD